MRSLALTAVFALTGLAVLLHGQRSVLILTDGTTVAVRGFEEEGGRVRYFSVERGQWEVVPSEIIDWERTNAHNARESEAARVREEETHREIFAERRARTELHDVPLDDGVYYLSPDSLVPLEQATLDVATSTKRKVLNVITPMPVITGKRTMSMKGLASTALTTGEKPAFYLRLHRFTRFGIARVEPEVKRDRRVVQEIYKVPRTDEQAEAQEEIDIFRQQLAPLVYKVWPVAPLEPGEYAVFEYTPGESDLRAWDFSHRSAGP